jgi:D-beta-D-heptose 7-phosphate kinase/D-beta-D-heptose 1-phosphate adenosyltransferase
MIAIIGDIMLDEYLYGSSTRQSPECDSAPVIVINSPVRALGGAGNTAINIHHLGGDVKLYCSLSMYTPLYELLRISGIKNQVSINTSSDVVKRRIYGNGKYIARLDIDSHIQHDEDYLIECMIQDKPDIILISDYCKGTVTKHQKIIQKAKSIGAKILVDSKSNLSDFKGAFVLKPNIREFFDWLNIDMPNDNEAALNKLHLGLLDEAIKSLDVDNLIITLGDLGCLHVSASDVKVYPTLPIKAIDVTGAGDTFIAGLSVALSEGKDIKRSIQFANRAASIAVTKKGTQYVERNEI